MKITAITLEGPNGDATITRHRDGIEILRRRLEKAIETKKGNHALVYRSFRLTADLGDDREVQERNWETAALLHEYLEGCRGCNGDIRDYASVIERMAC